MGPLGLNRRFDLAFKPEQALGRRSLDRSTQEPVAPMRRENPQLNSPLAECSASNLWIDAIAAAFRMMDLHTGSPWPRFRLHSPDRPHLIGQVHCLANPDVFKMSIQKTPRCLPAKLTQHLKETVIGIGWAKGIEFSVESIKHNAVHIDALVPVRLNALGQPPAINQAIDKFNRPQLAHQGRIEGYLDQPAQYVRD
jgi:hypothetical protein